LKLHIKFFVPATFWGAASLHFKAASSRRSVIDASICCPLQAVISNVNTNKNNIRRCVSLRVFAFAIVAIWTIHKSGRDNKGRVIFAKWLFSQDSCVARGRSAGPSGSRLLHGSVKQKHDFCVC
jgi:hypothetical protein